MRKYHLYFLREDEWEFIKAVMKNFEDQFEGDLTDELVKLVYARVNTFNHISVPNIEDMTKKTDKFIGEIKND